MNPESKNLPTFKVNRRLTFCAGHRVHGHETKCQYPHGHNYVVHVTAEALRSLDGIGRVIDFSVLKEKLGTWIDTNWDHAFIFWKQDEELLRIYAERLLWKHYILPSNPTAENMAAYLLNVICPSLFEGYPIAITRIMIEETENCQAEVTK